MQYLQAEGPHRWSWSAETWRETWLPPTTNCSMEAYAAETDSRTSCKNVHQYMLQWAKKKTCMSSCFVIFRFGVCQFWPVQSVAHLNGDQHRQSHCHGWSGFKHFTVNAGKVLVLSSALHEVGLGTKNRYSIIILLWNVPFIVSNSPFAGILIGRWFDQS